MRPMWSTGLRRRSWRFRGTPAGDPGREPATSSSLADALLIIAGAFLAGKVRRR